VIITLFRILVNDKTFHFIYHGRFIDKKILKKVFSQLYGRPYFLMVLLLQAQTAIAVEGYITVVLTVGSQSSTINGTVTPYLNHSSWY